MTDYPHKIKSGQLYEEDATGELYQVAAIYGTEKPIHIFHRTTGEPKSVTAYDLSENYTQKIHIP